MEVIHLGFGVPVESANPQKDLASGATCHISGANNRLFERPDWRFCTVLECNGLLVTTENNASSRD
jgi:hypothetical protein